MKRLALAATALFGLAFAGHAAQAAYLNGYLAECTAVATGSCTELTGAGYARQPVAFSEPAANTGQSALSNPYTFGPAAGAVVGRAIYDAPTGGNVLFVLPLATAITPSAAYPDLGDVGSIRINWTAFAGVGSPLAGVSAVPSASAVGTTQDGSTVSSGVGGTFNRGIGFTEARGIVDPGYDARTLVTGFSVTPKFGASTFVVNGAGTLATGTVTLPAAPVDGQSLRLLCGVTVTALTVSANAGQTALGSVTTCGASAGHEWFYEAGDTTWYLSH